MGDQSKDSNAAPSPLWLHGSCKTSVRQTAYVVVTQNMNSRLDDRKWLLHFSRRLLIHSNWFSLNFSISRHRRSWRKGTRVLKSCLAMLPCEQLLSLGCILRWHRPTWKLFPQLGTNQIAIKVLKRLPADFGAEEVLFSYCWSRLRWEVERWLYPCLRGCENRSPVCANCYPNYLTLTACKDKRAPAPGPKIKFGTKVDSPLCRCVCPFRGFLLPAVVLLNK